MLYHIGIIGVLLLNIAGLAVFGFAVNTGLWLPGGLAGCLLLLLVDIAGIYLGRTHVLTDFGVYTLRGCAKHVICVPWKHATDIRFLFSIFWNEYIRMKDVAGKAWVLNINGLRGGEISQDDIESAREAQPPIEESPVFVRRNNWKETLWLVSIGILDLPIYDGLMMHSTASASTASASTAEWGIYVLLLCMMNLVLLVRLATRRARGSQVVTEAFVAGHSWILPWEDIRALVVTQSEIEHITQGHYDAVVATISPQSGKTRRLEVGEYDNPERLWVLITKKIVTIEVV